MNSSVADFTTFTFPHICSVMCTKLYQLELFDEEANAARAAEARKELQKRRDKSLITSDIITIQPMTKRLSAMFYIH